MVLDQRQSGAKLKGTPMTMLSILAALRAWFDAFIARRRGRADQRLSPRPPGPRQREYDLQIEHEGRLLGP